MLFLLKTLTGILPVLYTLVFCIYLSLLLGNESPAGRKPARSSLAVLVMIHLLTMLIRGMVLKHCPLIGMFELISFMALALSATHLAIEKISGQQSPGVPVLAMALILQVIASTFGDFNADIHEDLRPVLVHLHIFFGLCGHAGFLTALVYALLYLTLHRQIKGHRLNRLYQRLPPLAQLHSMNLWAVRMGLILYTLSIATGTGTALYKEQSMNALFSSGACWLGFVLLLLTGKAAKLSGRRFAIGTLLAVVMELISLFVTQTFHVHYL